MDERHHRHFLFKAAHPSLRRAPLTRLSTRQYRRQWRGCTPTLAAMPWWFRAVLLAAGYVVLAWIEVLVFP